MTALSLLFDMTQVNSILGAKDQRALSTAIAPFHVLRKEPQRGCRGLSSEQSQKSICEMDLTAMTVPRGFEALVLPPSLGCSNPVSIYNRLGSTSV